MVRCKAMPMGCTVADKLPQRSLDKPSSLAMHTMACLAGRSEELQHRSSGRSLLQDDRQALPIACLQDRLGRMPEVPFDQDAQRLACLNPVEQPVEVEEQVWVHLVQVKAHQRWKLAGLC